MRRGWPIRCCVLAAVVSAAWAQTAERAPVPPAPRMQGQAGAGGTGDRPQGGLLTTMFRGREVSYEVIDGWAVHDGDILLGRAAEMQPAGAGAAPAGDGVSGPGLPRAIAPIQKEGVWPGGVIPYEIVEDATDEELRNLHTAIREWNERTAITLVPRTGQRFYARFLRTGIGSCSSSVGPGSPAVVLTVNCGYEGSVHEIGHLVGLFHEHQRQDRNEYVMLRPNPGGTISTSRLILYSTA